MAAVKTSLEVLIEYDNAFRELVNARVWATNESPLKALRLNSDDDWEFICVAMDVIGDAALALEDFLRFGLDGPSRYDSVGEKYLRLYGLLSATYLQQEAALKLYHLMNCPKAKDVKKQVYGLAIRTLRHQIASHSVDYRRPDGGKNQAFVPVRIGLQSFSCDVTENRSDSVCTVKLDDAVNDHCKLVAAILDTIYEKSIKTLFRGQSKRIAEFTECLQDLRFVRAGNMLIRIGGRSSRARIRIVRAPPQEADAGDA
jgi:hypothetical protein